nr:hypothetical protein [Micromonospora sp. NBRC 107566]
MLAPQVEVAAAGEDALPGEQFVQDAAEGVQVALCRDPRVLDLFGRHVVVGAEGAAGRRDPGDVGAQDGGDAEVEELDRPVRGDQHVVGFEVTVYDGDGVGVGEVLDACRDPGLAAEPFGQLLRLLRGVDGVGADEFDGDLAVEDAVVAAPDLPHAPGADLLDPLVPAGDRLCPHGCLRPFPTVPARRSVSLLNESPSRAAAAAAAAPAGQAASSSTTPSCRRISRQAALRALRLSELRKSDCGPK